MNKYILKVAAKKVMALLPICLSLLFLSACSDNDLDDMQGTYDNITHYNFTSATVQPTVKLHKGIKALNVNLTDAAGNQAVLSFGSKEWILAPGTYTGVASVSANAQIGGTVGGKTVTGGSVDVNQIDSVYYINGLLTLDDGSKSVINYHGQLTFVVGVDDPEASGYTFTLTVSPVTVFDMTTYQQKVIDGVKKYTFTISNEQGQPVAEINAINNPDMATASLPGTYTVAQSAQAPLTVDAGYCVPQYNMAGGTFYTDDNGKKQYISGGTINISLAHDADGNALYSFQGTDLSTIDGTGAAGTGAFKITYTTAK